MGFLSEIFELIAADGSTRSVKGYKASKPKAGTSTYNHKGAGISKLPAKVDLRQHMTPVEDQGETNSCTANAAAGAFEYLFKRHNGVKKDVSRLYIYYNGRYMAEPDNIEDEGACISDIVDGLKEYGACMEKTWNFDPDYVNDEPEAEAYEEGGSFVVGHARLVEVELDAWKTALAAGNPIIFGLNLYNSFDKQRKPGLVTSPSKSEESRGSHAGHIVDPENWTTR